MVTLVVAIALTLGTSFLCSLLEGFILSTTPAEIEALKKRNARMGAKLELFREEIESTSTAILTLNTIAGTAGTSVIAIIAARQVPEILLYLPVIMTVGVLVIGEIFPKTIGVVYRRQFPGLAIGVLTLIRGATKPVSFVMRRALRSVVKPSEMTEAEQEEEIKLLADRSVQAGALDVRERDLIANALSLDDVKVSSIMTPRTVVFFLEGELSLEEVMEAHRNLQFARVPVYGESIDDIVGIVRRRDILQHFSEDNERVLVRDVMGPALFIPETASALQALQLFLKKHQQFAVVVDEYGSTAGVITMEDIVEHLLGSEIYEATDVAVDMRRLAEKRAQDLPPVTRDPQEMASEVEEASSVAQEESIEAGEDVASGDPRSRS